MWFKGNNEEEPKANKPGLSDKAAGWLVKIFLRTQGKFAKIMDTLFNQRSLKRQKLIAVLFCLIAGSASGIILIKAITTKPTQQNAISIDHTSVPKHFYQTGDETKDDVLVDDYTMQQIKVFENGMDSLRMANSRQHDSILKARPGLLDSIKLLRQLYHQQTQK